LRTKRIKLLLVLSLILLPSFSLAEVSSTQSISGIYYHVEGNKDRSFYPANEADNLYEGTFDFKNIPLKGHEAFGNIEYRSTDDKLIDPQGFSIERMYMGARDQVQEILIGDFYQSFSEYSLSNALKGLKLSFGNEKSSRLILLGGIDTSRWENLWEERHEDSASRRHIWGARLENNYLNKKLALNFNYAGARDDKAFINSSNSPILVNILSVESRYDINSFVTAYSELSQSFTDEDIRDGAVKTRPDHAVKLGTDLNINDYTLSSVYSRIGNHFTTTSGFSAQDLETLNFYGLWFLPWNIKFTHYLYSDRDNLSDTKATTTRQLNPGGKFNLNLPLDVGLEFSADMRKRFSTDKETNGKTYTYSSRLTRDFGAFFSEFGYTKEIISDRIYSANERSSDIISFALDGYFTLKDVNFSWNLSEDIDHTSHKEVCEADFSTTTNAGLKLTFPSTFTIEARLSFSNNDYYLNDTDSENNNYFLGISRQLVGDSLAFSVFYERKGYSYYGGDNNYADNIFQAKLSYTF